MELPYVFDLLYDVKRIDELHSLLAKESLEGTANAREIASLMLANDIPFPAGYEQPICPENAPPWTPGHVRSAVPGCSASKPAGKEMAGVCVVLTAGHTCGTIPRDSTSPSTVCVDRL